MSKIEIIKRNVVDHTNSERQWDFKLIEKRLYKIPMIKIEGNR